MRTVETAFPNRRRPPSACAISALGIALAMLAASASRPARAQALDSPVVLRLGIEKTTPLVGEPVHLLLYATNTSPDPITISSQFYAAGQVKIEIHWKSENLMPQRFTGMRKPAMFPDITSELDPGETRELMFIDSAVYYRIAGADWDEGLVFPRPSEARLEVTLDCKIDNQGQTFGPKSFELKVLAPTEAADIAVLPHILGDKTLARCLQLSRCDPAQAPLIERLIQEHPTSAYTPHLRMALLGGFAFTRAKNPDKIVADLNAGLLVADAFLAAHPDSPYAAEAFYRRAVCYNRLGRPGEAMDELVAMTNRFPVFWRIQTLDKLVGEYIIHEGASMAPTPWSFAP